MIRGRKRPIAKMPEIKAVLNCSIHNRFDIEVVDAVTGEIKQQAQAENIICNALWAHLLTPATYFNCIHFGTGTGTPAATDTALFAFLGYKAVTTPTYNYNVTSGWASLRQQCQLTETEYVGSTLTEVGIGYSSGSTTLMTHAMLKDMNGNPISIAKTNTDIINIYATVFVHWDTAGDDSGTIKTVHPIVNANIPSLIRFLLGISGSFTCSPLFMQGGCYPHISMDGAYPAGCFGGSLTPTYNASNKTITLTCTRLSVSNGNLSGGIGSVAVISRFQAGGSTYGFANVIYPAISLKVGGTWYSGTSIIGEAIGTGDGNAVNFATDFDRLQSGAKIYVDSVEQTSGVTVDTDQPFLYTEMGKYFELIEISPITEESFPAPVEQRKVSNTLGYPESGSYAIYYNPFYSFGIKSFTLSNVSVYVSDDLTTWVDITAQYASITAAYRTYKYWKIVSTTSSAAAYIKTVTADTITSANNIHFAAAPANGAVITADYTTKTIAKDANHVFDMSVVITLGEKTT